MASCHVGGDRGEVYSVGPQVSARLEEYEEVGDMTDRKETRGVV